MVLKRLSIIYRKQLPNALVTLTHRYPQLSLTKDGLCDFPPVRAYRCIMTLEWSNTQADRDIFRKIQSDLSVMTQSGIILAFEPL